MAISCDVGPRVLHKAQITDRTITMMNWFHGKKKLSDEPRISFSYSVIVYPIVIPTITPRIALAKTRTIAS